jgi:hypothetical protein
MDRVHRLSIGHSRQDRFAANRVNDRSGLLLSSAAAEVHRAKAGPGMAPNYDQVKQRMTDDYPPANASQ